MRCLFSFLTLILLVCVGFSSPASAQNEAEISTIYLDEMEDFYQECATTPEFKNIYDCRCLSIQYLDTIQNLGQYDRQNVIDGLDKSSCPWTEDSAARQRNKDIPQAYLDEAQAFYESCGDHMIYGSHYNCECLSSTYLDERIKLGRFVDPSLIKMNIARSCASKPAAAGYAYKGCMKRGFNIPVKFEIEEYCTCIANEYAKMYVSAGQRFSPKLLIALQTEAGLRCRKKL